MSDGFISDPATYRKLCEPFPSIDAANETLQAFQTELRELRKKHKIADVHVIVSGLILHADCDERAFILSAHHGDPMRAEQMTAWALGQAQADRQVMVGDLLKEAKTVKRLQSGK